MNLVQSVAIKRVRLVARWAANVLLGLFAVFALLVVLYRFVNPPFTLHSALEELRLGSVERKWVEIESVPDHLLRALVAAEDANFCLHWGFDIDAIRAAIQAGGKRGASTISQQVAKNVFLWQDSSVARKLMEVPFTLGIELVWSKRRILEVYMNVVEFDEGIFGAAAATRKYFDQEIDTLDEFQSARLAVVLPSPKTRDAAQLSETHIARMFDVLDGVQTIAKDGRSTCFDG